MSHPAAIRAVRRGRGPGRSRVALLAALVGLAGLLGGCTSPRDVLGTTASPCYGALAVARVAVHQEGRFSGVRRVAGRTLLGLLEAVHAPARDRRLVGPRTDLCLVAYRGHFAAARLERPFRSARPVGPLAVVVVRQASTTVVGTLVLERAPLRLTRVFPLLR